MKLYLPTAANNPVMRLHLCPGKDHPETTDFLDSEGKPLQIVITFKYGVAENIPDAVGKYMLDQKMASRSRILMPKVAEVVRPAPHAAGSRGKIIATG